MDYHSQVSNSIKHLKLTLLLERPFRNNKTLKIIATKTLELKLILDCRLILGYVTTPFYILTSYSVYEDTIINNVSKNSEGGGPFIFKVS
jgi:hypothetical protein